MPRLIDRYILREVIPPFLIGLLLITFVLLMNQVLLLADLFIDKGVPFLVALRVLALLIPSLLVFALPMAVLMGILGGLARLAADSEIVALGSLGVGPRRLARPLAAFGLGGFLLTLPLALYVGPRCNDVWVRTMTDSVLARVRLNVDPLEFNETLPDIVFMVKDVGRDKTWHNVFAYLNKDPANPRLVLARSGRVNLFPEKRRALLELADGVVYAAPPASPGQDTLTTFDRLEEDIDVEALFPPASRGKRVREKDIGELVRDLKVLRAGTPGRGVDDVQVRAHLIEIHKKLALPAACLVFALLGLPLGLMTGRSGRTGGFSLAVVIILIYYGLLTAGETAAVDGRLSAFLAMWGADLLLLALGLVLFFASARGSRFRGFRAVRSCQPSDSATKEGPPPGTVPLREMAAPPGHPLGASVRFPGLLDRYISRKFLVLFGLALAAFSAAVILVTFLESLSETLQRGKPVGLLAGYVWFKLPGYLAFLSPVDVLASSLLALGLITRTNEATAMKACGVSAYRTVLPVLVWAAVVGGLAFLIQERVVPASAARAEAAWNALHDLPPRASSYLNRHWILARTGDRIYHYEVFEPGTATLGRLSIFDLDPVRWTLVRRTFAETASLQDGALISSGGWIRDFRASPGAGFVRSGGGLLEPGGESSVFAAPFKSPVQMTARDLRRYTAEVRAMGLPAVKLRAELAQKTAMPFVSLIMALLAVPFGFSMGKKGTLVGIGMSVAIAMAYWGTFAAFRSLGEAGVLTPFLGAWGASLLFGLGGLIGLLKLRT